MRDRLDLLQRFDYDLWANMQWLNVLEKKLGVERDNAVFAHILAAQEIWLQRCNGVSLSTMPEVSPTVGELERLHAGWTRILSETVGDPVISYRRTTGEELAWPVSLIAAHLLNHGTYHRGELRGLCRARGDEEFPETDLGRWYPVSGNF